MIGLGLGIHKSNNVLSALKLLTRNSDWAIWGDKTTGVSKGVNSPATNPIQDLVGNADGTLQGFAFTPASGYVDVPVKGVGDEISYSNLVTNGDLIDSNVDNLADNWTSLLGTTNLSCVNGIQKFTPTAQYGQIRQTHDDTITVGRRYFAKIKVKSDKTTCNLEIQSASAQIQTGVASHSGNGNYQSLYQLLTVTNQVSQFVLRIRDNAVSGWTEIEMTEPLLMRIDNNPQVQALESKLGRQLTAAECDYLFDFTATTNTIKAKVVTGIQGDGVNDVILLPSNAPNPVGLQDFGFAFVFKTPSANTVSNNILYALSNGAPLANIQLAILFTSTLSLRTIINGTSYTFSQLLVNTFYKLIIKRVGGSLIIKLQNAEVYNQANATNIIAKGNPRLFAYATNVGGTTYLDYGQHTLCYADYNNGTDIEAWEVDQNKAIKSIYGL